MPDTVTELRIGEVARRTGVAASAIRYYESRRLISPSRRTGGSRRYDPEVLERLALITFAKNAGFTLGEIRRLLAGFREGTTAAERWRALAESKLAELKEIENRIATMRALLRMMLRCGCVDMDECARRIAAKG